ncbi:1423_t:CDS:1, partial [Paraglomus brasilianum]
NHDRKQSWSDAVDEEFEGMDFSAPVIFNDDEDLLRLEKEKENIEQKDFNLIMAKIQEKKISNIPPTVLRIVAIQNLVSVLTTVPPSDNLVIIVQRLCASETRILTRSLLQFLRQKSFTANLDLGVSNGLTDISMKQPMTTLPVPIAIGHPTINDENVWNKDAKKSSTRETSGKTS